MTHERNMRLPLAVAWTIFLSYVVATLLHDRTVAGVEIGALASLALVAVGSVGFYVLAGRLPLERRKDLLATGISLVLALLVADTTFTVWSNTHRAEQPFQRYDRLSDPHLWHGELYPRHYFPTQQRFVLYKPNVRHEGLIYGEYYEPRMLASQTLANEVLRRKPLVYTIDEHGLRNRVPLEQSRIWVLGDSYALGFSTTEGLTWVDRLGELIGQPVYNLAVSGTGPGLQLQLLEYVLREEAGGSRPERLLWMIFEGNDLESTFAEERLPRAPQKSVHSVADDTLIGDLLSLPATLRRRSLVGRLRDGGLRLVLPGGPTEDAYQIDGVPLIFPIYRSERWGHCMFNPYDLERATRDQAYVLSHPNRPKLDQAFERMRSIAQENGFRVTVLVAPSAPRIYGRDFPDMPQPSPVPHLIRYVEALAERVGFETIDLLGPLSSDERGEMLYYCDDHHWSEQGNEVVAQTIASRL